MSKKILMYVAGGLCMAFAGCGKYLEKEPDNRAKLTEPKKVSQLLGTAYPLANYMAFTEAMSDNATDKRSGNVNITNEQSYAFENVRESDQDSPEYYWNACYSAIAASNEALATCEAAEDKNAYAAQKGEALLTRAYSHFMLVTLFARPYVDATSAANNKGIPYVLEPESIVFKNYTRGTVAQVYQQIEKDLLEGLPLINDKAYDVPRYHFNRAAANAFAARFYLYKKEYSKAVSYANEAVPNLLSVLRPWNTTYQTLGLNELPLQYQRSTEPANLLLVSCPSRYGYNFNYATVRYGLSGNLRAQIISNPAPVTGGTFSYFNGSVGSQANVALPKLHMRDFAYESPTSDFGLQYSTVCLLTTEEVMFNKAEANANLGNYDAAIADLNTYMSTRLNGVTPGALPSTMQITQAKIQSYYGGGDIKTNLIRLILGYKRSEYVQEGMRWFDILRHDLPVTHVFAGEQGNPDRTDVLVPGDVRRLLKLPDGVKLAGIDDLNR